MQAVPAQRLRQMLHGPAQQHGPHQQRVGADPPAFLGQRKRPGHRRPGKRIAAGGHEVDRKLPEHPVALAARAAAHLVVPRGVSINVNRGQVVGKPGNLVTPAALDNLQGLGRQNVIRVKKQHDVAGTCGKTGIESRRLPAIFLRDDPDAGRLRQRVCTAVGRTVVNDDNLIRRPHLRRDAGQTGFQKMSVVEICDDHRNSSAIRPPWR